jgi:hypothetical protein
MADPFFMIMAMKNLGPGYVVWDKAAEIEFVEPGRGAVTAEFRLAEEDLDAMRRGTEDGAKFLCWLGTDVRAADGQVVARVRKQLYVRRAREGSTGADGGARAADHARRRRRIS